MGDTANYLVAHIRNSAILDTTLESSDQIPAHEATSTLSGLVSSQINLVAKIAFHTELHMSDLRKCDRRPAAVNLTPDQSPDLGVKLYLAIANLGPSFARICRNSSITSKGGSRQIGPRTRLEHPLLLAGHLLARGRALAAFIGAILHSLVAFEGFASLSTLEASFFTQLASLAHHGGTSFHEVIA